MNLSHTHSTSSQSKIERLRPNVSFEPVFEPMVRLRKRIYKEASKNNIHKTSLSDDAKRFCDISLFVVIVSHELQAKA